MTALKSALKHMAKKLRGPDPPKQKTVSSFDLQPIHAAASQQNLKDLEFYLKKYEIGVLLGVTSTVNGQTLLHHAARKGHLDVMRLLLDYGADPNIADSQGATPLHVAASEGKKDAIEILVAREAKLDAADATGWQPLACAAVRGHRDTVELLLDKGADIRARNRFQQTALHAAVDHPATLQLLIDRGAEVDAADFASRTPLMCICAQKERVATTHSAAILVKAWASLEAADEKGQTARDLAGASGSAALVRTMDELEAEREANKFRLQKDVTVRRIRFRKGPRP